MKWKLFYLGCFVGTVLTAFGYEFIVKAPTQEEMQREYDAYRDCIQTSRCLMTAQDYIDYYSLKWELEQKQ